MSLMKLSSAFFTFVISTTVFAADKKMKMNFNNEEITKVIEAYSKSSEQTFIVDPSVRGKISIFNSESIEMPEAFNQLSSALAINGFGISKQENTFIVKPARSIQRDLIEVTSEIPALKPERMVTWVMSVKNLPAKSIARDFRMLVSRDGEITLSAQTNQIILTDWASNLVKVAELMKQVDKPVEAKVMKLVEQNKRAE